MDLNFAAAIALLGTNAAFRIANAARPPAAYLLNDILPEEPRNTYHIDSGSMTIRPTMAGQVAMDSEYPPVGAMEVSKFLETTAKIGNQTRLSEETLRAIQYAIQQLIATGGGAGAPQAMAQEALNFLNLIVIQPQLDCSEWLRGQALSFGALNWQFNKKGLTVNYGVPASNILTLRLWGGGTGTAYGATGSLFWADIQAGRRLLRAGGVRVILAHPDTIDEIRYNPANELRVTAGGEGGNTPITFRRVIPGAGIDTSDTSDQVTLVPYGLEGEIIDPNDPDSTIVLPFIERGRLIFIGNNVRRGYRPGMGAIVEDPNQNTRLGYTHMAPTVEGGNRPGRWSDLFTPQHEPWALIGRAASNQLPVIENPDLLVIGRTEMAP